MPPMSFRTNLFHALEVADFVTCNGQSVISKMLDAGPQALLKPYVDLADGTTFYILDEEVLIEEGRAYSTAHDGKSQAVVWIFLVVRALEESDVERVVENPTLKVDELVNRLKQIERQQRRGA